MESDLSRNEMGSVVEDTKVLNSLVNDDHELLIKIFKYKEAIGDGCFRIRKKPVLS